MLYIAANNRHTMNLRSVNCPLFIDTYPMVKYLVI